jgi:hypothetical protein
MAEQSQLDSEGKEHILNTKVLWDDDIEKTIKESIPLIIYKNPNWDWERVLRWLMRRMEVSPVDTNLFVNLSTRSPPDYPFLKKYILERKIFPEGRYLYKTHRTLHTQIISCTGKNETSSGTISINCINETLPKHNNLQPLSTEIIFRGADSPPFIELKNRRGDIFFGTWLEDEGIIRWKMDGNELWEGKWIFSEPIIYAEPEVTEPEPDSSYKQVQATDRGHAGAMRYDWNLIVAEEAAAAAATADSSYLKGGSNKKREKTRRKTKKKRKSSKRSKKILKKRIKKHHTKRRVKHN